MDLSPTVTVNDSPGRDKRWLKSQHGQDSLISITLDIAGGTFDGVLTAGSYAGTGKKVVPSGIAVFPIGNGLYRKCAVGEVAKFHIFEDVVVTPGATANAGASGFWHGVVVQAKLPGGFVNANKSPFILYV